jgi:hypothetical protein
MRSLTILAAALGAPLMLLVASCGSSSHPSGGLPQDAPALVAPAGVWTWIDVPESQCDDGSPTGFAVNPQDTSDLFIFFEGGGACWDYLTCFVVNSATHGPVGSAEWATRAASLPAPFDRTRATNPFSNATMVYIPYCTGDLHAGDNVAQYSGDNVTRTYYHKGRSDTVAFLNRVTSTWRAPTRVVFSGSSAGGYGAALTYDLMRKTYPATRMYLIDDAGTLLEGDAVPAAERTAWFASWNLGGVVDPLCPGCRDDLSGFYTTLASRYPNDRMALLSSLQDDTISAYFMLAADQFQTDLLQMLGDRLTPTLNFRAFLISGSQHTLLGTPQVTTQNVVLESWLGDMVNDRSPWPTITP